MLNTQAIKSLTDLRSNPSAVIALAKQVGPVYIFNRSKPTGVVLDIDEYGELVDWLDDVADAREIKRLKKKAKKSDFIAHEDLMRELGLST